MPLRDAGEREPRLPDDITGHELDSDIRGELRGLGAEYGKIVGRHLVAVHLFLAEDPELAWRHAVAARRRAARLGAVREAVGLAAYHTGRFAEALAEFRTARRLTGSSAMLPLMADSERGLGRPERALDLARAPEAADLDLPTRIELLIVAAGARQDLGEPEAALSTLAVPELEATGPAPWLARLRYAYAQALAALGRDDEAAEWTTRAHAADPDGAAGITETDNVVVVDLHEEFEPEGPADGEQNEAEPAS
jgi:tetratricopeptide (TPR) repeat protein